MAATPDTFAARSPYEAIEARPVERNVEQRWPDLCHLLTKVGAVCRSDPLPVPPLPPAFDTSICVETLASLQGALHAPDSVRVGVIGGRGGLGKTSAASAFAGDPRTQDAFDCVLWRTIGRSAGRGDLRSALNDVLRALEGVVSEEAGAADLEKLAKLARAALERPGHRVLLVLDDLSDADHGEHFRLLSSIVPRAPSPSLVLATTRDVVVAARFLPASANPLICTMAPVAVGVAVQLLSKAAQDLSSAVSSLGALAEEVGRSPYALQLVARILRQTTLDEHDSADAAVDSVRERIAAASIKSPLVGEHAPPGSAPIYRTIEVALAETFTAKDRDVFSTFGLFAEDADVPIGLLCVAWSRTEKDRDDVLDRLCDAALVKRSGACVQLHDFAWDFACAERTPASMAAKQRAFLDRAKTQLCAGSGGGELKWAAIHGDVSVKAYLFRSLRYHLCAAGRLDEFTNLLFSLDWIAIAIDNKGLHNVIRDVLDHARAVDKDAAIDLRHLFQTLQLSAPGLSEGTAMHERLVAQLIGRLRGIGAVVQEGTRMRRLLAETEVFAARAMLDAEVAGAVSDGAVKQTWLLPVASTAKLRRPGGALQATLLRHRAAVRCACLLSNGLLASASDDSTICIWNASSGECLKTLTGHVDCVHGICAVGPEYSGFIASASDDKTVRIWNSSSGECLKTLSGHERIVVSVCSLGPDSGLIASASADTTIRIWSVSSGGCLKKLTGHSKGVKSVCSIEPDSGLIASASSDKTVRIWNARSGECLKTLTGHESDVLCVTSLGPDSGLIASASFDWTLRIWNVSSGACLRMLTGHDYYVMSVCSLGPDSGLIASASSDKTVRIWNARSGECLKTLTGHEETARGVCSLGSDSGLIASTSDDNSVRIWNVNGECLDTLAGYEGYVCSVISLGSDSGLVASTSLDSAVRIWSVSSGECLKTLTGHESSVNSVTLLGPDSGLLASASNDATVRIWSVSSGECLKTLIGHEGSVFNSVALLGPDSGLLASASWDRTVRIWSVSSGACLKTLTGHVQGVKSVCTLEPDSGLIASVSTDDTVRVWNVNSGECTEVLPIHSARAHHILRSSPTRLQIEKCSPTSMLSVQASHAVFLDDNIVRVCPVSPFNSSKGPFVSIAVFTASHQFHAFALLPVISSKTAGI